MRRTQQGSVFILALAVIAALVAIVAATAATAHTAAKARNNRLGQTRSRLLAEAAMQHALSVLSSQSATVTLQTDDWATLGSTDFTHPGTIRYTMGDGTYRIQLVDASSLINLNTASAAWLGNLPLTQEQVDSLTDWRTGGQTPQSDGGKDQYYNGLTNPYNTKLGNLDSVDELLLVRGWNKQALYDIPTQTTNKPLVSGSTTTQPTIYSLVTVDSESPNTTSGKVNVGVPGVQAAQLLGVGIPPNVAGALAAGAPYQNLGACLRVNGVTTQNANAIVNNLIVSTTNPRPGLINLNTATEAVLNSIPNMTTDITSAIISRQSSGFNQLSDFLSVPGVNLNLASQLIDNFTVATQTFLVRVEATVGLSSTALEAVIVLNGTTPRITKIYEPPYPDMPTRWGWYDVSQDTTIVDPASVTPAQ